ncbi:MFS transporter [Burkholderia sp. SRS-W-2-2016]|uniref:MFS transporter n=1 Tax=Burkholderia sp. SRS-W-2-2016 TaxID=1926878 RepID=UPI00094B1847|nr:MFS transporter [Burkholderia sp. SRS-W-2-2016]OLL28382.1 MFS transporter [Burkholderia sp. SRS-W-2-2016]
MSVTYPVSSGSDRLAALYGRLNWRLLPFLAVCYLFASLDRLNVGFAQLQMHDSLGFSDAVYGFGAGIFFVGYVLFEIPSNLLLPKVGVRRTISRILVLWGLTSAAMMFVHNVTTFYVLRFLLGVFEAGFTPGVIFYLTYWYGERRMAGAIGTVMLGGALSGVIVGPLSGWLMTSLGGVLGLAGWQWMFLVEGLPCVALGVIAWRCLVDRPDDARWLSDDERALLRENVGTPRTQHHSFRHVLRDGRVWLMAFAYFCIICGLYAVNFWLPSILKSAGVTNPASIGLYASIPYITAIIGMTVFGRSSDRFRERRFHSALPTLVGALGLAAAAASVGHLTMSLTCLAIATMGMWAAYTVFWAIPSDYLKGDVAAGGIALINTIGLFGGFLSPTIIGWTRTATGSLAAGLYVMVGLLVVGVVLLFAIRVPGAARQAH